MFTLDLTNRLTLIQSLPDTFEVGVELGVADADFSEMILANSKLKKLFSIDPWCENPLLKHWNEAWLASVSKLSKFKDRSELIRALSQNVVDKFSDESIDFIYLDSLHSYEHVSLELKLYSPKVKKGGIISGHDYGPNWQGVERAVKEFSKSTGSPVFLTGKGAPLDGNQHSWVILKNQ